MIKKLRFQMTGNRWVQFGSNKRIRNMHAMRSEVLRNFRFAGKNEAAGAAVAAVLADE